MNADGSDQRPLTDTTVIEESPDWQPIPARVGVRGARAACGDLSLDAGGIASVLAVRVGCAKALRVAERWADGKNPSGFRCTPTRHSMDQAAVEGIKPHPPRCRHRNDEAIAFVIRDTAAALASMRQAIPPAAAAEPTEVEELPEDDALPRGEED